MLVVASTGREHPQGRSILDRLLHHCKVINMKGHSYRLQGHAFANQLSPKGGDSPVSASQE
ncbi:ATP-binding protein [Geomonas sp. Red32]|uniref:ATP-binding protein n=1 Tax=Geomonas sp. Red32 TaxID=2912856 RepID=UPI00331304E9